MEGGRSSGRSRHGLRRALVVAEFALALTLLAGAGLVIHSFWKLTRVDLGFRQDHILTFSLPLAFRPASRIPTELPAFYRPLLEKISAIPGISFGSGFHRRTHRRREFRHGFPHPRSTGGGYRLAFQCRIHIGDPPTISAPSEYRSSTAAISQNRTSPETLPVAIVNESFVKKYLPNVDPLTQRVAVRKLGLSTLGPEVEWQIVGVISRPVHK